MKASALARIERRLISAEYLIDSTNTHVRRKKCDDVKPRALARYTLALNDVRAALQQIRSTQGARHLTLFAGKAGKGKSNPKWDRGYAGQKTWGSSRAFDWKKDCDVAPPPDLSGFDARFVAFRVRR